MTLLSYMGLFVGLVAATVCIRVAIICLGIIYITPLTEARE